MQNGLVDRFNGRMRGEFLTEALPHSPARTRDLIMACVTDHNTARPSAARHLEMTVAIPRPAARNAGALKGVKSGVSRRLITGGVPRGLGPFEAFGPHRGTRTIHPKHALPHNPTLALQKKTAP